MGGAFPIQTLKKRLSEIYQGCIKYREIRIAEFA